MQRRRVEHIVQHAAAHLDIAVGKKPDEGRHRAHQQQHGLRRAEQQQDRDAHREAGQRIHEVKAPGIEEPEPRHAVMHGMEAPEPRPFMRQTVLPVEREFDDDEPEGELDGERPFGGPDAVSPGCHPSGNPHKDDDGDQHLRHALVQHGMEEVRQHLAVIFEPGPFMRHDPFQNGDGQSQPQIGHIEGDHPMPGGHGGPDNGQRHSEEQRPENDRQYASQDFVSLRRQKYVGRERLARDSRSRGLPGHCVAKCCRKSKRPRPLLHFRGRAFRSRAAG